ncbi:hypothetical protein D3C87_1948140 [compost metagenome]
MLPGIVEHRCQIRLVLGKGDNLLQRLAGQFGIFLHKAIERRHIGLMVLAMVQFQGFLAHAALGKGGWRIGQGGKREGHFGVLSAPACKFWQGGLISKQ